MGTIKKRRLVNKAMHNLLWFEGALYTDDKNPIYVPRIISRMMPHYHVMPLTTESFTTYWLVTGQGARLGKVHIKKSWRRR